MSNFALKKVLHSQPQDLEHFLSISNIDETIKIINGTAGNADGQPEYVGFALPGTATSAPRWKIIKISYDSDGPTNVEWASGTSDYIYVMDDYAGYAYS